MKKPDIDWTALKHKFEENPALMLGAAAAFVSAVTTGVSQLTRANVERKNSKTYRREVARRERKDVFIEPPKRRR
jgi:hypothetical protein